jgi:hypothetical protein
VRLPNALVLVIASGSGSGPVAGLVIGTPGFAVSMHIFPRPGARKAASRMVGCPPGSEMEPGILFAVAAAVVAAVVVAALVLPLAGSHRFASRVIPSSAAQDCDSGWDLASALVEHSMAFVGLEPVLALGHLPFSPGYRSYHRRWSLTGPGGEWRHSTSASTPWLTVAAVASLRQTAASESVGT